MALPSLAQTITVPLGTAAQFGLLSGGTLAADTASDAHVAGKAGAATAITGPVQASSNAESGSVTAALTDLAAARAYCSGLSAATLTAPLNGQTLTGGAYTLSGNVTFGAGNPLVLQGADTTVFVINVTGDLTLTDGARVWLEGPAAAKNIIWNVTGNLTSTGYVVLPGVVMNGGSATISSVWAATSALLMSGDLTMNQTSFVAAETGSLFFAAESLLIPGECATDAVPRVGNCGSQADNGSFEQANLAVTSAPSQVRNVCNRLKTTTDVTLQTRNELAAWGSASYGTPDWFRSDATAAAVDVPSNEYNYYANVTPAHLSGQGYAGIYAGMDVPVGSPVTSWSSEYREYLSQHLAVPAGQTPTTPLIQGEDYYVEFFSNLAPSSKYTVDRLGLKFFNADPYQSHSESLKQLLGTGTFTPDVWQHDATFTTVNQWTRTAGIYHATGQEQFVTIGNFDNAPNSHFTPIPGAPISGPVRSSYFYIDDVQILPFPKPRIECGVTTQNPDPNGLPNPNGESRINLHLFADCPLTTVNGVLYQWTWTDPCQEIRANPTTPVPCNPLPLNHNVRGTDDDLFPPYPYAASYTLTVYVPKPGITNPVFPGDYYAGAPHTIANDATNGMFEFTIDETNVSTNTATNLLHITTSQTWAADMTIRGTITVWPGATLTINNHAVIRFDDTFRQRIVPIGQPTYSDQQIFSRNSLQTRILVKPGGHLEITDGAVLTSLIAPDPYPNDPDRGAVPAICHSPFMWDGVTAEGLTAASQRDGSGAANQAQTWFTIMTEGAIAHARVGLIATTASYSYRRLINGSTSPYLGWLVSAQSGRGRAIVTANNARFIDCWYGAVVRDCREAPVGNPGGALPTLNRFDDCLIQSTQFLADPDYRTAANERYGTQLGINLANMNSVSFIGNTFDGFEGAQPRLRGKGMQMSFSVAWVAAAGYGAGDRWAPLRPNTFQDWHTGMSSDGTFLPAVLTLRGNQFSNNYFAANLTNLHDADVRFNQFWVGGPGMNVFQFDQPIGLFFTSAGGVVPEENRFVPHPGCGPNTYTIGLRFDDMGASTARAYRNTFTGIDPVTGTIGLPPAGQPVQNNRYLYTGLWVGVKTANVTPFNTNVTFRCNNFAMPAPANTNNGNYPSSDVHIYGGTMAAQGICNAGTQTPPEDTPNNRFTDNNGVVRNHLYLRTGLPVPSTAFKYWFPADARMQPTACSQPFTTGTTPLVESCGNPTNDGGCPELPIVEDVNGLRTELAQAPAGSMERMLLLDRLVRELVTNYTIAHGLDSAIALLERENAPGQADHLLQLQAWRTSNGGGTSQRVAGTTAAPLLAGKRRLVAGDEAATTTAGRSGAGYLARLRDLLLPLGTDSARTVAVLTNAALRAELVQMAEDSLTSGYLAARAALNQYGGTNYIMQSWADGDGGDDLTDLGRAAAPPAPLPAAFVLLTPNPSTGHVRVGYGLPEKAEHVVLRVYDEWGQPRGEHTLTDEALTEGVTLRLRPGLYQCVLEADGKVMARERLLVVR